MHTGARATVVLGCLLFLAVSSRGARPWPDTTARIAVFADQLPGALTAAQRQFAATHLVGTQKQRASELAALRVYNPGFLCLHYQLAVGQGPAAFITGDVWASDWAWVTTQTNWFLLNTLTQRVHQTAWNWDVMDIRHTSGVALTGYPQYWITSCVARIAATGSDGVFADSFTQDAYSFGACQPTHPWLEDADACRANWIPQLDAFARAITNAFAADTNGWLYLPNLGGLITSWDTLDYGCGHGGMIEGFCFWNTDAYFDPADWRLQMTRALSLTAADKIVICQSYTQTSAVTDRMFALASYLLIKGARTYLNLLTTDEVALEYYPEYTLELGAALTPPAADIADLFHAPWGVYRRAYANGWALANPLETPVTIPDLGGTFHRATPGGGGPVGADGVPGGAITYTTVTSVTVAAHGGVVLLSAPPGGGVAAIAPTNVAAIHRAGQTFVTWREHTGLPDARYRIYRHTAPITATNLAQAVCLREVPTGSGRLLANRYFDNHSGEWTWRYGEMCAIADGAPPLAPGTGLLVWTCDPADFGGASTGVGWYAVTTVRDEGGESTDFTVANRAGPVVEARADPRPVLLTNFPAVAHGGAVNIYIQYMDLRRWNPTFHAPHPRNAWLGFNPDAASTTQQLVYAYDYAVVLPDGAPAPTPAYLTLHGWGGGDYPAIAADPDPYDWNIYKIIPYDIGETWYFGFARDCDFRTGAEPASGPVVNYTEQRLLRMLHDLIRDPPATAVDTNRIYVYGQSMGGSGTLALALRYPQVFAAAYASQPMSDYARCGDGGGLDWRDDLTWKWGALNLNLPVGLDAPAGWAGPLQDGAGTGVWDWQNHQRQIAARARHEFVPCGIGHGTNDWVIEWPTQGAPLYPVLNGARIAWGGFVTDAGHSWLGWLGLPPPLDPDASLAPFRGFTVRRDEAVPGLSGGSADLPLPAAGVGGFNQAVEWSAAWSDWDGAVVDEPDHWQVSLRSLTGANITVNVTPRRLTRFPKQPGVRVLWRNWPLGASEPIQIGQQAADANGLFLIPDVQVSPAGNRLRLELDTPLDTDADGMPDAWENAFGFTTNNPADGAQDADGDGVPNRAEYPAGTHPRDATSAFRITALGATQMTWRATPGFTYAIQSADGVGAWATGPVVAATGTLMSGTVSPTNRLGLFRIVKP